MADSKNHDVTKGIAPVLDFVAERNRLINEKKERDAGDLKKRFQNAMGWDKKVKKGKHKKKSKNKKSR